VRSPADARKATAFDLVETTEAAAEDGDLVVVVTSEAGTPLQLSAIDAAIDLRFETAPLTTADGEFEFTVCVEHTRSLCSWTVPKNDANVGTGETARIEPVVAE
jgi:hypothetical protein